MERVMKVTCFCMLVCMLLNMFIFECMGAGQEDIQGNL